MRNSWWNCARGSNKGEGGCVTDGAQEGPRCLQDGADVMGMDQAEEPLEQCPRAAEALAQRKVFVPPALPRSAGGFSRFGRRVLPVAGTAAAAIGLSGCAAGGAAQGPATQEQRVAQQVQDFTSTVKLPAKGKVIKAGGSGAGAGAVAWEDNSERVPASPKAVVVETRKGTPKELVPEGVVMRWAEKAAAEKPAPAIGVEEWTRLQEMAKAATSGEAARAGAAAKRQAPAELAADVGRAAKVLPTEWTQARAEAPVIQAAVMAAEPTFEEALAVLRKHAAERGVNGALAMALLEGSDGKGEALKNLGAVDQSLVGDLVTALDKMAAVAPGASLTERAGPLVEAAKKWQGDADLTLPKLALASRVDSFGVYTPVEATFEGGRRHSVIIYCEVANFVSDKGKDGWYTTRLAQQESLIAEDGLLVWRPSAEEVEDRSLNQRKDFYLVKKLTIPENLAAGHYTLRMAVTDRTGNKISMAKMAIEIK